MLGANYRLRGGLPNCRAKFLCQKKGRVAYLGGSITMMSGWRTLTYRMFRRMFPGAKFSFINAGIGGTDSTLGSMRLERDVFGRGAADLLFLEFAVNDGGVERRTALRAMEGIIRHCRALNPNIDILMMYFADEGKLKDLNAGKIPSAIAVHEEVAQYYGVPVIDMSRVIAAGINAKDFTWRDFSADGCHPLPFGHRIYLGCIEEFLSIAWAGKLPSKAELTAHGTPARPLDALNYERGRLIGIEEAELLRGFQIIRGWDHNQGKCNYSGVVDVLAGVEAGAALRLKFTGTAVGIYDIVGQDAGAVEYRIDEGPVRKADLFDFYCPQFHRPQHRMFADDLKMGEHLLEIRVARSKNRKSLGHSARILKFIAN